MNTGKTIRVSDKAHTQFFYDQAKLTYHLGIKPSATLTIEFYQSIFQKWLDKKQTDDIRNEVMFKLEDIEAR